LSRACGRCAGEDLVSKPALQDEAPDGRQDARAGRSSLSPSRRSTSALRRRRPIAAQRFRSRDPAAILPSPRDHRRVPVVPGGIAGVPARAEQHGTAGARSGVTRAEYGASVVLAIDCRRASLIDRLPTMSTRL